MTREGSRLTRRLAELKAKGRKALCMYVTASDPDLQTSVDILLALVAGGVDVIELGYPFCDPILDGAVISQANQRALAAGGSFSATLDIVRRFRIHEPDTPIVLMGYSGPLFAAGIGHVVEQARRAGADGFIVADCPPREAKRDLLPALDRASMHFIPLWVQGSKAEDLHLAHSGMGGFLYCVPQAGPTGGSGASIHVAADAVAQCRDISSLPVGVGFGIKTHAAAAAIAEHADLVIVGTAVIDAIHQALSNKALNAYEAMQSIVDFCAGFRRAIDEPAVRL
jgi:tryptophan synthase alpha chain